MLNYKYLNCKYMSARMRGLGHSTSEVAINHQGDRFAARHTRAKPWKG